MNLGSAQGDAIRDSRLSFWLSYAVLFAGVGAGVASAYIVISTYSPLPHWDEWALFQHLATGSGWSLAWLWAQHNEHRILIPKLFFLIDTQFFHGAQVFLLVSIFLVQLLQAGLLSFSLWTLGGMRGSAWRTGTGLILFCVLCPTQQENFIWGFQLQFVVPAAMTTLAVLSLLLFLRDSERRGSLLLLLLSIMAATIATWSLANGILLWPLLLLTAWFLPQRLPNAAAHAGPRYSRLILALAAAVNIGWYFYHYHRPAPQSEALPSPGSLKDILQYIAVYFGSTWVRHSSNWVALIAGTAGIAAGIAVSSLIILRCGTSMSNNIPQSDTRQTDIPQNSTRPYDDIPQCGISCWLGLELALLMLLCLVTAAITASGRLHLGLQQATASRYQTFALLYWCSLGLMLLSYLAHRPSGAAKLNAFCIFLLALMLGFGTQLRLPLIDAQWHQLRLKLVSLALLTGVHDPALLAEAYPDPQTVWRAAQYMRTHRLSIFAGQRSSQLGQSADAVYQIRPAGDCSGYVTSVRVLPSDNGEGLRMTGYAWDREVNRPAREIVAVVDGRIEGFGTTISIPLSAGASSENSDAARFGWLTLVREAHAGDKVALYAVVGKSAREICPFAEASQ
jgi:hypothetical protein